MPKSRHRQRAADPARPIVLPPEYDAVIEGDRRFFTRRHLRSYRVRPMPAIEREMAECAGQTFAPTIPGARWFTAIRQIEPGYRVRAHFQTLADADTDQPEEVCRWVYDAACGEQGHVVGMAMERAIRAVRGRQ